MTEESQQAFAQHLATMQDTELAESLEYYPRLIKNIENGKRPTFSLEDASIQFSLVQQEHARRNH